MKSDWDQFNQDVQARMQLCRKRVGEDVMLRMRYLASADSAGPATWEASTRLFYCSALDYTEALEKIERLHQVNRDKIQTLTKTLS